MCGGWMGCTKSKSRWCHCTESSLEEYEMVVVASTLEAPVHGTISVAATTGDIISNGDGGEAKDVTYRRDQRPETGQAMQLHTRCPIPNGTQGGSHAQDSRSLASKATVRVEVPVLVHRMGNAYEVSRIRLIVVFIAVVRRCHPSLDAHSRNALACFVSGQPNCESHVAICAGEISSTM